MPKTILCLETPSTCLRRFAGVALTLALLGACTGDNNLPLSDPTIQSPTVQPPSVDPQSIVGSFTLDGSDQEFEILEGSNGISITVGITRSAGHQAPVSLRLLADNSDNLTAGFTSDLLEDNQSQSKLTVRLGIALGPIQPQERQVSISATDGRVTRTKNLTLNVTPVNAPDVYLLIGQSNMVGSSELGAKSARRGGDDEPNPRIEQLNVVSNDFDAFGNGDEFLDDEYNFGNPTYITAEDPLHDNYNPTIQGKSGTRIGLGLSFAKAALPATTQKIILVPAAWSATAFCSNNLGNLAWNARSTSNLFLGGTKLFERALLRTNFVLQDSGGILRGILWHQGESDSTKSGCANIYEDNLKLLISDLRSSIVVDARGSSARGQNAPIPFILGTMSRGNDARGDYSIYDTAKESVDTVHRSIASVLPFAAVSLHDDLIPPAYPCGQDDCVHFGAAAYREMGNRYYGALEDILAR